jgi:hypothetical protein
MTGTIACHSNFIGSDRFLTKVYISHLYLRSMLSRFWGILTERKIKTAI